MNLHEHFHDLIIIFWVLSLASVALSFGYKIWKRGSDY